jgi:UDPglucose 6-dehydrogenase
MRCTVFGTGYLGATHAAGMAELGHEVVGVDIDPGKVAKLSDGDIPFYEPGLRNMLRDNLAAGRLRFTTDYDAAADFADVHFLGVGTPQKKGEYGADLRHVHAVIDSLVPRLRRSAVIVGKSTVPVGTAAELVERARVLAPEGVDVEVAWNPEFLREGFAVHDTLHPDRIVLGVQADSESAEVAIRELYAPLLNEGVPFLLTDLQTAELVKVSANAFLATKSRSSMPSPRCVKPSMPTSPYWPTRWDTTRGSGAASSTPVSASAAGACPRTSARSWPARARSAPTMR